MVRTTTTGATVNSQKQFHIHVKCAEQDRTRLRRLAEIEEMTASALVRRLIREKARELGVES